MTNHKTPLSVAEMTEIGEKVQETVKDIFYIDIEGTLYCKCLLFAMLATAIVNENRFDDGFYYNSKTDLQGFSYEVECENLPF